MKYPVTAEYLANLARVPTRAARRALQSRFGPGPSWLLTDAQTRAILGELQNRNRFKFSRLDPPQAGRG
jgi:hypothetical protein